MDNRDPKGHGEVAVGLGKSPQSVGDERITTGYADGTFRPFEAVTRAQMAAFIGRAFLEIP